MLSAGDVWLEAGRNDEVRYLDHFVGVVGRRERNPSFVSGVDYAAATAQLVFWVCARDRVHQSWVAALPCALTWSVAPPVVAIESLGGNPSVAGCGCEARSAEGWGGFLYGQVPR